MTRDRARQSDGQAYVRPASDDSVPLREHMEHVVADLRRSFDAAMSADRRAAEAMSASLDALRNADQRAVEAALIAAKEAVRAALEAAKEAVAKAEVAVGKQLTLLNELRTGVVLQPALDSLAEKLDGVRKTIYMMTGMGVILSIAIPIVVTMLLRK